MRYLVGILGGVLIAISGVVPIRTAQTTLAGLPVQVDLLVVVPAIAGASSSSRARSRPVGG